VNRQGSVIGLTGQQYPRKMMTSESTFRENLIAVLRGQASDKILFAPYDNLVPRGLFERRMRNRGMGLLKRVDEIWAYTPGVVQEISTAIDGTRITYRTPVGSVSTLWKGRVGRIDDRGEVQAAWLIKAAQDFDPVLHMVRHTAFEADYNQFLDASRDLGQDGLVRGTGPWPPYDTLPEYFGLVNWAYFQKDHPERMEALYQALDEQEARRFPLILDSPSEFISFGSLNGFYGPKDFERYTLPFYQTYVPLLKARGKICGLHAHNSNLRVFKDLLRDTGVQVIEAYTPPPISDLSLPDARQAWGDETIIWVNFPETIFWSGKGETYHYTLDLLESDPCPEHLVIGMTEMGTYGVTDDESEKFFTEGICAIMDAIDDFAGKVT
jgi:hypothetical protein